MLASGASTVGPPVFVRKCTENRMRPYTATQMVLLALGLARFLAEYDADRIPDDRKIQVRLLAGVGL